jgi:hypothetical protein
MFQNDNMHKEELHLALGIHCIHVCVVHEVVTSAAALRVAT